MWDPEEELADVGEVLQGMSRTKILSNRKSHLIHECAHEFSGNSSINSVSYNIFMLLDQLHYHV